MKNEETFKMRTVILSALRASNISTLIAVKAVVQPYSGLKPE